VGVLIAHEPNGSSPAEFTTAQLMSWVSTPTPKGGTELSATTKKWCAAATSKQSDAAPSYSNGDQRGVTASMIVTRGGYRDLCLTTGNGQGYWELLAAPDITLPVLSERAVNLQNSGSHGDPATSVNTVWGQIGTDIISMRFHGDGHDITAHEITSRTHHVPIGRTQPNLTPLHLR